MYSVIIQVHEKNARMRCNRKIIKKEIVAPIIFINLFTNIKNSLLLIPMILILRKVIGANN